MRAKMIPGSAMLLLFLVAVLVFSACGPTASYQRGRQLIQENYLIPAKQIRVDEYLQGHEQGYAIPEGPVALYPATLSSSYSVSGDTVVAEMGIKAGLGSKVPVDVAFVLDRSGSMGEGMKMPLLKSSVRRLVSHLTEDDRVVAVTFESSARVLVGPGDSNNRALLLNMVQNVTPTGSTDLASGLNLGFKTLTSLESAENRKRVLILITDAMLNTGTTEHETVVSASRKYIQQGINFTAVGLGASFNDALMSQLSRESGGNYYFIDSEDEARRVFDEKFTSVLFDSLRRARMTIQLEQGVVLRRVFGFEASPTDLPGQYEVSISSTLFALDEIPVLMELSIGPGSGTTKVLIAQLSGLSAVDSSNYTTQSIIQVSQSTENSIRDEHVFKNVMIAQMALTFQRVWDLVQAKNYLAAQQEVVALKENFGQISGVGEDPQLKQDLSMIALYEQTIQKLSSEKDVKDRTPREQDPLKPVSNP